MGKEEYYYFGGLWDVNWDSKVVIFLMFKSVEEID